MANLLAQPAVTTLATTLCVEVEMVGMGCIRSGTEDGREPAASGSAQRLEEADNLLVARCSDALAPPAGELEPGDVDGEPTTVSAHLAPLDAVA